METNLATGAQTFMKGPQPFDTDVPVTDPSASV